MITYKCQYCGRDYDYDKEVDYSKKHCSATCQYGEMVENLTKENEALKKRVGELETELDNNIDDYSDSYVRLDMVRERLRKALKQVEKAFNKACEDGTVTDTIWVADGCTLTDCIDGVLHPESECLDED